MNGGVKVNHIGAFIRVSHTQQSGRRAVAAIPMLIWFLILIKRGYLDWLVDLQGSALLGSPSPCFREAWGPDPNRLGVGHFDPRKVPSTRSYCPML
jgi:hypothetical protein